jgi:O-antigen/teichoic acid export membrane protein
MVRREMLDRLRVNVRQFMILQVARLFPRGGFAQNALIMMTGTTVAQGISIAIAPILTRLFTPNDFGILAVYSSFATLVAVFATGNYYQAIMLPEKDDDAVTLMTLSMLITCLMSFSVFIVVFTLNVPIAQKLGNPEVAPWLYLVPISVFLTGVNQILYAWSNRKGLFKSLSLSKVSGASGSALASVSLGFAGAGVSGLFAGSIIGQMIPAGVLGWPIFSGNRKIKSHITYERLGHQAKRYSRFLKFSLPSDLVNAISQQSPVILLSSFFGATVVGYFSLSQRILGLPISLIAESIMDAFRQRASHDYVKNGNCRDIYIKTFRSLFLISIVPFVIIAILSPFLFSFIFGLNWRIAGEYAQILSALYFFKSVCSPLRYMYYVAERQKEDLIISISSTIASIGILVGSFILFHNVKMTLLLYSMISVLVYVFIFFRSLSFANGKHKVEPR